MTLAEIRDLLTPIDPDIRHYFSQGDGRNYTYWEEGPRLGLTRDDRHEEAWKFYVHRFTKDERDPIAARLYEALDGNPCVAMRYEPDYEPDTGYIHHIFECEAI